MKPFTQNPRVLRKKSKTSLLCHAKMHKKTHPEGVLLFLKILLFVKILFRSLFQKFPFRITVFYERPS
jgi:hypothetical protein